MTTNLTIVHPKNQQCYYIMALENNAVYVSSNTFKTRQDAQQAMGEWQAFFDNNNTIKQTKIHGATPELRKFWEKINGSSN